MPNAASSHGGNARVLVVPVLHAAAHRVAALAAAVLAVALSSSATAHAEPAPDVPAADPKAQCESPEVGGLFVPAPSTDAVTHAVCQYIVDSYFYYDTYDDGAYTGTLVYRDGAKVPTERPVLQKPLNIPTGPAPLLLIGPPS
jgi:hypothetical protein